MNDQNLTLRLLTDTLASEDHTEYPSLNHGRGIYLVDGNAAVSFEDETVELRPNEARFTSAQLSITAGPEGATLLRWELLSQSDFANSESAEPGVSTRIELEAPISMPRGDILMRCDRVDFPPGGVAYSHVHRGPGIRCLLHGEITVEVNGESKTVAPRGSWFETGSDPVFAVASQTAPTAFVRVMILPAEIQGKSSITYVNEEDRTKPKSQKYTIFVDQPLIGQLKTPSISRS
jgi:quercetin dioxygenase-like cupin family protein